MLRWSASPSLRSLRDPCRAGRGVRRWIPLGALLLSLMLVVGCADWRGEEAAVERAAAALRAGKHLEAITAYQALEVQFPEAAQRLRSGERIAEARRALQEAYQLKQNLEVAQQMLRHAERSKGDGLKTLAKTWAAEASTLFSKEEAGCCDKVKLVLKQASYFVAHLESPPAAQSSKGGQAVNEADQLYVTVNAANVRSGAGTQHGIVAQLQRGDPVSTLEEDGSWVKVRTSDGSQGWIYRSLLSDRDPN